MSATERTGWRDLGLKMWHESLGINTPATDIDHLLIEYNEEKPVAIIEHKSIFGMCADVFAKTSSCRAIRDLADAAGIPFLLVRYTPDLGSWQLDPLNEIAVAHWLIRPGTYTAEQYAELLYRIRRRPLPRNLDWDAIKKIRSTPFAHWNNAAK